MLDPLNTLSLASSIVQLIEFGSKLLVDGYNVYTSNDGASEADVEIEGLADDLNSLCTRLAILPANKALPLSEDEIAIQQLANQCIGLAAELSELLQMLKVDSHGLARTWQALKHSVKRKWKSEEIDNMMKRLERIKAQLGLHLMKVLWNQQSAVMSSLNRLSTRGEEVHFETTVELAQMKKDVLDALRILQYDVKALSPDKNENDHKLSQFTLIHPLDDHAETAAPEDEKANATSLNVLSQRLDAILAEGSTRATTQHILDSLTYPKMQDCQPDIEDVFPGTYKWIFEQSAAPFRTWLEHHAGLFWISGKAGCGKSTLMNMVAKHRLTREILETWASADEKIAVIAQYSFWNSEDPIQCKLEGLLRSLLHQILRRFPHLIQDLVPERWAKNETFQCQCQPWTPKELMTCLRSILTLDRIKLPAKFCFFIDGLDQYKGGSNGSHRDLIELLGSLAQSDSVKICVASRPWSEFRQPYGRNKHRFLVMETLTKSDIDVFVRHTLGDHDGFTQLMQREHRAEGFVEEILNKAQGVFLWVSLVVKSLLRGVDGSDEIADLELRLRGLPPDLEKYYKHLLDSTEDIYRDRAARIFQLIVQEAPLPLTLVRYLPLEIEDENYILRPRTNESGNEDCRVNATDKINAWCRDLLEVNEIPGDLDSHEPLLRSHICLPHCTVADFLQTNHVQELLRERIKSKFDPLQTLVRLYIYQAKSLTEHGVDGVLNRFLALARKVMVFAKKCEIQSGSQASLTDLLKELDLVGTDIWKKSGRSHSHWSKSETGLGSKSTFTDYAVMHGLVEYFRGLWDQDSRLLRNKLHEPFLRFAMESTANRSAPINDMLQFLLELNANPNKATTWVDYNIPSYRYSFRTNSNSTLWQRFLRRCYKTEDPQLLSTAHILLKNGADPNVKVDVEDHVFTNPYAVGPSVRESAVIKGPKNVNECLLPCCKKDSQRLEDICMTIESARERNSIRKSFSILSSLHKRFKKWIRRKID